MSLATLSATREIVGSLIRTRDMDLSPEQQHGVLPNPALAHGRLGVAEVATFVGKTLLANWDAGLLA